MLRPFAEADVAVGFGLTTGFGWPHRAEDWALMGRLGEGVVAEADGAAVGTALRWEFGPGADGLPLGTIGLIAVAPGQQGRGLGRALTEAVLRDGTTLLNATAAGRPLYEKLGFEACGVVVQYQGVVQPGPAADIAVRPADPAQVRALDREATGMDRGALLDALFEQGDCVMAGEAGFAQGFAMVRPFGKGTLVGPVVARDPAVGAGLIGHCLARLDGKFVRVDVPEESGMIPLLQAHGLGGAWPVVRMVRGLAPRCGPARVFALASQAWG